MANSFGSLYIGASGLRNAQNALNTTANNMSNVDTNGYVRQQVRFAEMNYNTFKLPYANVNLQQNGLGVSIGDVVHARDIFLDKTFRLENGRREFYSVRYETADYTQVLMQELDGEEFKQSVIDLWQAFQVLSSDPASSINQNLVLQKSELLVSRSQALYSDIQSYQSNVNEQIKNDVERVNEIGNRIYELNLQIQKVEAGGIETAMTLRDERDMLLDEISQYGRIEVTEDATGFVYLDFECVRFVDDNRCYNMALDTARGTGFYTPYWPQLSAEGHDLVAVFDVKHGFDSEMDTDVGGIKSKLMIRGDYYGRATDMESVDAYNKIAHCTLMKVEAQLDMLFSSIVKSMNDLYCPNMPAGSDLTLGEDTVLMSDVELTDGTIVPAGETIAAGSTIKADSLMILDEKNAPVGVDGKLPPREIFVRIGCDRYTEVTGDDGKTYYVYNAENTKDTNTMYNIGNVSINRDLIEQITLMPAYTYDGSGRVEEVDYGFGAKLAQAWADQGMKLNPYDAKPCTFEEYYDRVAAELGIEGSTYKTATETLEGAVASIDNKRQMVTGVSSDEELTQMIKFQSAYNAASRYITVISQMTELIVTGLI